MTNTILNETAEEINTLTYADLSVGDRFYVTISGKRQLVEKTEYLKSGSTARNVRKLEGRKGRGFVYSDAVVELVAPVPARDPWAFRRYVDDALEAQYEPYMASHPSNGY